MGEAVAALPFAGQQLQNALEFVALRLIGHSVWDPPKPDKPIWMISVARSPMTWTPSSFSSFRRFRSDLDTVGVERKSSRYGARASSVIPPGTLAALFRSAANTRPPDRDGASRDPISGVIPNIY